MRLSQKRGKHMRCFQIEVVVRPIKICGHERNKIGPILARKCLAKFYPRNFGDSVSFVRWLERPGKQGALRDRLRGVPRVDARTAEKQNLADAACMSRGNN